MTKRKTIRETDATIRECGKVRAVIVTVYPSGVIGFRLKRTRREYCLSADDCYRRAVAQAAAAERPKRVRRQVSRSLLR